jgi:hypothetical protein
MELATTVDTEDTEVKSYRIPLFLRVLCVLRGDGPTHPGYGTP